MRIEKRPIRLSTGICDTGAMVLLHKHVFTDNINPFVLTFQLYQPAILKLIKPSQSQ